jgi:APA family basic amino acid/polyamine antiporter
LSHSSLVGNGAPFVDAFQTMFGDAAWVGKIVAGTAVVSGLGALNGWTLVTAEMPFAAAKDGLFVPQFAKTFKNGTPWFGILVSTAIASALMAFAYSGRTGLTVFTYLVNLSVVTVAIPYLFSACAQLAYLVSRRRVVNGWALTRDVAIAVTSVLFSLWVAFTAGYAAVYQAMLFLLLGLPIYAFIKARRERLGQVPAPVERTASEHALTPVP